LKSKQELFSWVLHFYYYFAFFSEHLHIFLYEAPISDLGIISTAVFLHILVDASFNIHIIISQIQNIFNITNHLHLLAFYYTYFDKTNKCDFTRILIIINVDHVSPRFCVIFEAMDVQSPCEYSAETCACCLHPSLTLLHGLTARHALFDWLTLVMMYLLSLEALNKICTLSL